MVCVPLVLLLQGHESTALCSAPNNHTENKLNQSRFNQGLVDSFGKPD
jgi:hypothetical protein